MGQAEASGALVALTVVGPAVVFIYFLGRTVGLTMKWGRILASGWQAFWAMFAMVFAFELPSLLFVSGELWDWGLTVLIGLGLALLATLFLRRFFRSGVPNSAEDLG
ncbi:hypothetical protein [Arthrobacter rhombi]|nr:hypothetical protein [Arthrobacter rhombi]